MQLKTLKRLVGKFRISTIAAPENEAIKSVLCHLSVENKFFNQSDFADRLAIYVHTTPQTKTVCFVGCVSNKLPNNFFVDGCGCQEVHLCTSLTNSLTKLWSSGCCNLP